MADNKTLPQRVSSLAPINREHIVDYAGVRLSERKALTAIQVLTFRDRYLDAAKAIGKAFKFECPTTPGTSRSDGKIQLSWNGPNGWMLVCSDAEARLKPGALLARLQKAVGDLGAVVDQSHGRCGLRLSGPRARQVMAKNTTIDLHPRAFGPGQCALTSVAHMNATIVQIDDTPTYDLFVARSLARSFAQALEHACHEFERDQNAG